MLLVIPFVALVTAYAISYYLDKRHPYMDADASLGWLFIGILFTVVFVILSIVSLYRHVDSAEKVASSKQRYESLVYQAENGLYDNDNDFGKKELVNQIQEWNEELAYNKGVQRNIWVGFMYPNIYDQFEFIPLELVK